MMLTGALLMTPVVLGAFEAGTTVQLTPDTTTKTATDVPSGATNLGATPADAPGLAIIYQFSTSTASCTSTPGTAIPSMMHGIIGTPGANTASNPVCSRSERSRDANGDETLLSQTTNCTTAGALAINFYTTTDCTGAASSGSGDMVASAGTGTCATTNNVDEKIFFNCATTTGAKSTIAVAARHQNEAASTTDACGQQILDNCYNTAANESEMWVAGSGTDAGKTYRIIWTNNACTGAPAASYTISGQTCYLVSTTEVAMVNPNGVGQTSCAIDFDTMCTDAADSEESSAAVLKIAVAFAAMLAAMLM